jgi:hypothetical protein
MRRSLALLAYAAFMGVVFAALWRWGVLERIGPVWTTVAAIVAVGFGAMVATDRGTEGDA